MSVVREVAWVIDWARDFSLFVMCQVRVFSKRKVYGGLVRNSPDGN